MAIQLHSFVTSAKRYFQVESQAHHITGIFRKIIQRNNTCKGSFNDVNGDYYECEQDGTITFYQAEIPDAINPGIWTYIVYECPEGEEKVFPDTAIDTSDICLRELFGGRKLFKVAVDIHEYIKYKFSEKEYLEIELPFDWQNQIGRRIANLLVEEFKAFKSSTVFANKQGKEYIRAVLDEFIQIALEILEKRGTVEDFEQAQLQILNKIKVDDIVNFIVEYNDYRIWQVALPSKSKAIEYAFNSALNVICRMK
ncbi:MAG: hypothetical protein KME60_05275 [Cyanomargarita calcarea GSE-NOS-MK-12-04C]|jgi:hypothetical protein|uniref:Uncharacterized protein n=1 Tax=Cyanomargarita calcarea GSE-NOS-MK-12-04C TaxID=2839659 RepID=A0A951UTN1_9CYAN|nr:hypothetical protein [Cyanomargarita calcarea GSE-NOS-MK-12-04C]